MNSSDTSQPDKGDQDDYLIDSIHFSMASRIDLLKIQKILSANGLPEKDVGEHIDHFMLAWDNGTLVATVGAELLENDGLLRSLSVHLKTMHINHSRR